MVANWRDTLVNFNRLLHDINYHTFKYWQTKLRESQQQQGGFIEISPIIAATENTGVTINRLFHFCENRNHERAYQLLEGFSGVMHSDKYGCYEHLAKSRLWQRK